MASESSPTEVEQGSQAEAERLRRENKELREGACRFHCRTRRSAFRAGYLAALDHIQDQLGCEEIIFPVEEYGKIIDRSYKEKYG